MQRPVKVRVTVSVSVRRVATFSAQLAVQCAADSRPAQRRVSVPSTHLLWLSLLTELQTFGVLDYEIVEPIE